MNLLDQRAGLEGIVVVQRMLIFVDSECRQR